MTDGLYDGQDYLSPQSKTITVFNLTARYKDADQECSHTYSTKERAAKITLYVVLMMVVLTAVSLLLGEVFGLQWSVCFKPQNTTLHDTRYQWPWNWKHDRPSLSMSESFKDRWITLSLPEKRKELLRATLGELDLYDVYDISKDNTDTLDSDENT